MNHSLQKEIDTNTLTDQQAAVDAVPLEEIDVSRPELVCAAEERGTLYAGHRLSASVGADFKHILQRSTVHPGQIRRRQKGGVMAAEIDRVIERRQFYRSDRVSRVVFPIVPTSHFAQGVGTIPMSYEVDPTHVVAGGACLVLCPGGVLITADDVETAAEVLQVAGRRVGHGEEVAVGAQTEVDRYFEVRRQQVADICLCGSRVTHSVRVQPPDDPG